jgi:hypothetical protein
MPKQKSLKLGHNIRGLDDNPNENYHAHIQKPPLLIKKNYNGAQSLPSNNNGISGIPAGSYVIPTDSGIPANRP